MLLHFFFLLFLSLLFYFVVLLILATDHLGAGGMEVWEQLFLLLLLINNAWPSVVSPPEVISVSDCDVSVPPASPLMGVYGLIEAMNINGFDDIFANKTIDNLNFFEDILSYHQNCWRVFFAFDFIAFRIVRHRSSENKAFILNSFIFTILFSTGALANREINDSCLPLGEAIQNIIGLRDI